MHLTERETMIIAAGDEAGKHTVTEENAVTLTQAARKAFLLFEQTATRDTTIPFTESFTLEEFELFLTAYVGAYTRTCLFPLSTDSTLQVALAFTEKPINVFGDAHRYEIRVIDAGDGDPVFFITEHFIDQRYPTITHTRTIKLTRASLDLIKQWATLQRWETLSQWIDRQQNKEAQ